MTCLTLNCCANLVITLTKYPNDRLKEILHLKYSSNEKEFKQFSKRNTIPSDDIL